MREILYLLALRFARTFSAQKRPNFSASAGRPHPERIHGPDPAHGLRDFNAAGAHPSGAIGEAHNPETRLIPSILQAPNGRREAVGVFGDGCPTPAGTCVRDCIHVTGLAQAHIAAQEPPPRLRGGLRRGRIFPFPRPSPVFSCISAGHDILFIL